MSLDFINLIHLEGLSCLIFTHFEDLNRSRLVGLTNTCKESLSIMSHAKLTHDCSGLVRLIALVDVKDVSITTTAVSFKISTGHIDNTGHLDTSFTGPLLDPIVAIFHVDEIPHVHFTSMAC